MSHSGPPARPCDSWGPLRQLRPTAHSDSLIMGGRLLWFPNTHADTCTHMYTHAHHPSPGLLWPLPLALSNQATAGATCPSEKGKVAIFDISIKLPYQESMCSGGGGGVFCIDREAGLTFFCSMFFFLSFSLFVSISLCGEYWQWDWG